VIFQAPRFIGLPVISPVKNYALIALYFISEKMILKKSFPAPSPAKKMTPVFKNRRANK
jgi:hypothetical protein